MGGGQFFDFIGGDTAVMREDIELMGVPPLGKILTYVYIGQDFVGNLGLGQLVAGSYLKT